MDTPLTVSMTNNYTVAHTHPHTHTLSLSLSFLFPRCISGPAAGCARQRQAGEGAYQERHRSREGGQAATRPCTSVNTHWNTLMRASTHVDTESFSIFHSCTKPQALSLTHILPKEPVQNGPIRTEGGPEKVFEQLWSWPTYHVNLCCVPSRQDSCVAY